MAAPAQRQPSRQPHHRDADSVGSTTGFGQPAAAGKRRGLGGVQYRVPFTMLLAVDHATIAGSRSLSANSNATSHAQGDHRPPRSRRGFDGSVGLRCSVSHPADLEMTQGAPKRRHFHNALYSGGCAATRLRQSPKVSTAIVSRARPFWDVLRGAAAPGESISVCPTSVQVQCQRQITLVIAFYRAPVTAVRDRPWSRCSRVSRVSGIAPLATAIRRGLGSSCYAPGGKPGAPYRCRSPRC